MGLQKQKHIRGDKTLNKYNFVPNVVYIVLAVTVLTSGVFFRIFACGLGFTGYVFHELLPPRGRLRYEAYNVEVSKYPRLNVIALCVLVMFSGCFGNVFCVF